MVISIIVNIHTRKNVTAFTKYVFELRQIGFIF
jgi:hypothetical protein